MISTLHANVFGKGRPLLILHGFLGMSDNWKTLGKQFATEEFSVHLLDQRNHGRSFHSPVFNYQVLAADVKNYLFKNELSEICIIGHSMGGKTAMEFATTHPELVEKLVVVDIAPKYYPAHHQEIVDALNALPLEKISSRGEADERLSENLTDMGIRQFLLKNLYWESKGKLAFRFNLPVLSENVEVIGDPLEGGSFFNGPSMFLRGGNSEYVRLEDLSQIHQHFPNAVLETVENAGHWVHAENPREFYEKTLQFLKA